MFREFQTVKRLPTIWETRVRSLGWEDLLEKEMATHSSTLAWKSYGRRSLISYRPQGRKESDMTERLCFNDFVGRAGSDMNTKDLPFPRRCW